MARIPKNPRMTSPAITLGERGRRRLRVRRKTSSVPGPATGGIPVSDVLLIVILSGQLPSTRIDQDVDHVRQEVEGQYHKGDDHENPLDQRVVEFAEGVVKVEADSGIVEDDLNQDLAGDDEADRHG